MKAIIDAVDAVAAVIDAHTFTYRDEHDLQDLIAETLTGAGFGVRREVELGHGRIDLVVGGVGIEVKVDGAPSEVSRQLRRYARSDEVDALLLVTNRANHRRLAGTYGGRDHDPMPVGVLVLGGGL